MKMHNLDYLINIKLKTKSKPFFVEWKPRIKFLWITFQTAGFYHISFFGKDSILDETKLSKYIIDGTNIYRKPYVELTFRDKITVTKSFETEAEAEQFVLQTRDDVSNKVQWLQIY